MTKKKVTKKKKSVRITDGPQQPQHLLLQLDQRQVVAIMAATLLAADPANRSELAVKKAEELYESCNKR
jgi:hypothetical protein